MPPLPHTVFAKLRDRPPIRGQGGRSKSPEVAQNGWQMPKNGLKSPQVRTPKPPYFEWTFLQTGQFAPQNGPDRHSEFFVFKFVLLGQEKILFFFWRQFVDNLGAFQIRAKT